MKLRSESDQLHSCLKIGFRGKVFLVVNGIYEWGNPYQYCVNIQFKIPKYTTKRNFTYLSRTCDISADTNLEGLPKTKLAPLKYTNLPF